MKSIPSLLKEPEEGIFCTHAFLLKGIPTAWQCPWPNICPDAREEGSRRSPWKWPGRQVPTGGKAGSSREGFGSTEQLPACSWDLPLAVLGLCQVKPKSNHLPHQNGTSTVHSFPCLLAYPSWGSLHLIWTQNRDWMEHSIMKLVTITTTEFTVRLLKFSLLCIFNSDSSHCSITTPCGKCH